MTYGQNAHSCDPIGAVFFVERLQMPIIINQNQNILKLTSVFELPHLEKCLRTGRFEYCLWVYQI